MIVTGQFVAQWVAQRLGVTFKDAEAIGISVNGKLAGGVVYHDFRKNYRSIQMSAAADGPWLTKGGLGILFHYPFVQLGCQSVYACVAKDNQHARDFVVKVGFKPAGLLRKGFGSVDAVLYDMLAEECRWTRSSHERHASTARAA